MTAALVGAGKTVSLSIYIVPGRTGNGTAIFLKCPEEWAVSSEQKNLLAAHCPLAQLLSSLNRKRWSPAERDHLRVHALEKSVPA